MTLTLRPGVLLTTTEYGMALLDQNSGDYWTLNPTAAVILRALLDGKSTEQAVSAVTEQYDVAAEVVRQDIGQILHALRSAELLVP